MKTKTCIKCGKEFQRVSGTVSDIQWKNRKYCSKRCARLGHIHSVATLRKMSRSAKSRGWIGGKHPSWKGGTGYYQNGYVWVRRDGKTMLAHRYIVESYLERKLLPEERVHHINGIKDDNRIENLMLLPNESAHWYEDEKAGRHGIRKPRKRTKW